MAMANQNINNMCEDNPLFKYLCPSLISEKDIVEELQAVSSFTHLECIFITSCNLSKVMSCLLLCGAEVVKIVIDN